MKNVGLIVMVSLLFVWPSLAQPESILQEANQAYQNNQYEVAAQQYEQLLKEGYQTAQVHYNLGNAYFRMEQLGNAVLNYERAYLLAPNDADIRHNLKVARQHQTDQLETVPVFFLKSWWHQMRMLLSSTAWSIVALVLLWIGVGGLILFFMAATRKYKKMGFIGGVIILVLSILPFLLAASRASYEAHTGEAVILEEVITLRSAPDPDSQENMNLHEGLKVSLLDEIGDWKKVRLPDGEEGWLPQSAIEEI